MSKAVLISIKPQWAKKIFEGKKTIEIRRTHPSIDMPFKVYVYETKAQFVKSVRGACTTYGYGRGKVIGSFVCDRITNIHCYSDTKDTNIYEPYTCLTGEEICEYLNYEDGYGWHITEPKLFDKPRELREFRTPFPFSKHCLNCEINENRTTKGFNAEYCSACSYFKGNLTRPPQSYCFVEIDEI